MVLGLSIALAVIIADQFSKYAIDHWVMAETSSIQVTSFFNLVAAWNTGVSFSMFNDGGIWGIVLLSSLALVIVCLLIRWLTQEDNRLIQISLGFIIGGAIGNVIDRIFKGAVFDFLDFYIGDKHWPAFNVADSFICIGAVLIIVHSFIGTAHKTEKGEK